MSSPFEGIIQGIPTRDGRTSSTSDGHGDGTRLEGVQPTTAAVRSIGRWEPVCISLCNSKSCPVLLFRRVIQTGSHRSGRITAEIHQSGRWLPRARDGIWCAGHCSKSVPSLVQFRGPSDWLGPWNLTNNVLLQCSSVCSKTYSLGSVYVDLPVFGPS